MGKKKFVDYSPFSRSNGTPLEKVDWMPQGVKDKLYDLGADHLEDFYSLARGEPEPTRKHLRLRQKEYKELIKKAEQELPKKYVKLHDEPRKRHPRGLITD